MAGPSSGEIDYIVAWTGQHSGQALDSSHSYVSVQCDDSKTLFVAGHLFKTNLPNQQLQVYYKLDGSAPYLTPGTYTTSADGTGDFAFSVQGITSGSHVVIVEINHLPDNLTYYMDNNAANGGAGIPVTCP